MCETNYGDESPDSVILLGGRVCGCSEDRYFRQFYNGGKRVRKCLQLPTLFDRDNLKLEFRYDYNGETFVYHEVVSY